jgi:D-psicose/D-tagatose/L-ribulose 3-epimerase
MRFGCCVNMLVPLSQGTGAELVEQVAASGFEYLELPLARMAALSEPAFSAVCRRVELTQISTEACNDFFPPELKLTGPLADISRALSYSSGALERAARLGAKVVVFGSGGARAVPDDFPKAKAYEQLVQLLAELGALAEANDLTIAIEPLNRTECNIIYTLAEAYELAKRVNHNRVQVLADYYHLVMESEPVQQVSEVAAHIRHVHVSDPAGRIYPHSSDANLTQFFRLLAESGYDGRMSVEAYSQNFEQDAAVTLPKMRQWTEFQHL